MESTHTPLRIPAEDQKNQKKNKAPAHVPAAHNCSRIDPQHGRQKPCTPLLPLLLPSIPLLRRKP
jgi:hypothetical protein